MLLLLCNVLAIYIAIHLPLIEDGSLLADCLIKNMLTIATEISDLILIIDSRMKSTIFCITNSSK